MVFIKGVFAVGVSVAALAFAAPAHAAWSAVALVVGTIGGDFGIDGGGGITPTDAAADGMQCQQAGGTGCTVVGTTTAGCVAAALGPYPHYESALGPTIPTAEANAEAKLTADGTAGSGSANLYAVCTDGTTDGWQH
jgi:uncharacterized membrane protein YfcA